MGGILGVVVVVVMVVVIAVGGCVVGVAGRGLRRIGCWAATEVVLKEVSTCWRHSYGTSGDTVHRRGIKVRSKMVVYRQKDRQL